jgi:hypothetical protein
VARGARTRQNRLARMARERNIVVETPQDGKTQITTVERGQKRG